MDNVRVLDKKNNRIEFENGYIIDMLSSMYKKGIGVCD